MNKQQIIDKIQKLLALANSDNENEAKTAAAMAQSFLTKYNLTMTEVEQEEEDKYVSEFVETDRQRQDPAWKYVQSLLREFFFVEIVQTKKRVSNPKYEKCMFWPATKTVHCYIMFGQPHNVAVAKYVRDFLTKSFVDLFAQYRKQTGAPATSRNSYYLGLFKGLHEQLKSTKQKVETETGLVVVEDAGLKDFIQDNLSGKIKNVPAKHVINADPKALDAGYEKGKNLSIAMGLEKGEQKKQVGEVLKLGSTKG